MNSIKKNINCDAIVQKNLVNHINNLYDIMDGNYIKLINIPKCPQSKSIVITDYSKISNIIVEEDYKTVFVTAIAGGGAGGFGFVDNFYFYSGGGGGAGACCIKKPYPVKKGSIINVKIGKGGSAHNKINGDNTQVTIYYTKDETYECLLNGGENGHPKLCDNISQTNITTVNGQKNITMANDQKNITIVNDQPCTIQVDGGQGGTNHTDLLKGESGFSGNIALPSNIRAIGGNGGSTFMYEGGNGGGNYFHQGGASGNINTIIGSDGLYGSGGGGSAPKSNLNFEEKISGIGGNGIVIMEFA